MKKSLLRLPKFRREDIRAIVKYILEDLPDCEMIIFYGDFVRNDYSDPQNVGESISSDVDYDFLILVSPGANEALVWRKLEKASSRYRHFTGDNTTIQFLVETISRFNKFLTQGRCFYTGIKRDGVLLHDSKRFKLSRMYKTNYDQVKDVSRSYFDEFMQLADNHFQLAREHCENDRYKMALYYLGQTCEGYCQTINMVFMFDKSREQSLSRLIRATRKHIPAELYKHYPCKTDEDRQLFEMLCNSQTDTLYHADFEVGLQDILKLVSVMEQFRETTNIVCQRRIENPTGC